MKPEDLIAENVGRKVLIESLNGFDDARATLRAWSRDFKTVYVSLDSTYGKGFRTGELIETVVEAVRFNPNDRVTPLPELANK